MKLLMKIMNKANGLTFVTALLLTCFISSCRKIIDTELNKGDTPLALSADKLSIVLSQQNDAADALNLTWTSGTNKGTHAAINYTLLLDTAGGNFSIPLKLDLGKTVQAKKYSVKELNDLLIVHWKLRTEVEATILAKVTTTIVGDAAPGETSNTLSIKIKPYKAVSTTLFLIGDATPNGWDAGKATPLTATPGQPGKFSWIGNLSAGEFKFITNAGQFLPSYNKGATNNSLVYRSLDAQPDEKFRITTTGPYTIDVDLLNLTISLAAGSAPPYSQLWVVGDATPNGWNIDNPNKMRVDSGDLWVFHFNEVLKAGEFKIPTSTGNWGADFYMPLTNHQPLTETGVKLVPGGNPDNKWQVTNAGPYKIALDLKTMKIAIKPFTPYTQLWMVGDATPAGWNIDNPQTLNPVAGNPFSFVYEGPMNAGEFKIPVAKGNWGTDYFMPVANQSGPGSTLVKFVSGGNPDHKWRINDAGNYRITIDQLRETISIIRL